MRFDRFLSLSTRSKKLDPDRTFVKLSSIIRPGVHWRRRITQGERRTFDDGAESCLLGEGCIVVDDPKVKLATARAIMGGFQRHEQASLLSPYVGRYFTTLGRAWQEHGPEFGLTFAEQMYPRVVADETVVRATDEYLAGDAVVPSIRRLLLEGKDDVLRILQARGCDTARGLVR